MRILVVTPWFPTADSPVSGVFVRREVEALSTVHDVTVLHLDWQRGAPLAATRAPGGHDYRHVPLNRSDPRSYLRARRLVGELSAGADVVHTHALTGLLPWLTGRPGGPDSAWVHSEHWSGITAPDTLARGERIALSLLGPRLRGADAVIAESTRLAEGIARYRPAAVEVVPCIVRRVDPQERTDLSRPRLIGIGGIIPRKGPVLAVHALAELVDRGVDAELTWVGEGAQRDEVLTVASRRGVADRVRLTGALDDDGVARELAASTMFILPTQGDNFCIVAAEALSSGRPIVSGAASGAVDYSDPTVSRFVSTQTGEAYADAVEDLHDATREMTATAIAATVQGRFSAETVTAQLTDIYARILMERRERRSPDRQGLGERASDWLATHPSSIPGRLAALRFGIPRRSDSRDVSEAPSTLTRILITPANYAGQAGRWAAALEEAAPDVGARTLAVQSSFRYPADAVVARRVFQNSASWQRAQLHAARAFTHVLVESLIPPFGRLGGRDLKVQLELLGPQVSAAILCHGTEIRSPRPEAFANERAYRVAVRVTARNRALLAELGLPVFVSTPDLLQDVPEATWVPVAIDVKRWSSGIERVPSAGRLRVVHAPSSAAVKGTAAIRPIMTRMAEAGAVEYAEITGVPHDEMPQIYADADVVLDQFRLGSYGAAACEAMAAGKVVVSHVHSSVRQRVQLVTGLELPIVESTAADLESVLLDLAADPGRRERLADEGRAFVSAVHDGRFSADALLGRWIAPASTS
ncbi:glycosyltransferase [Microbacterium esteraromaticum]|uniref:glycosyltransferase n=1 Tax=Microbacterium esteraromaticum TaxID=57043 RepID=UPI001959C619|nr:glycosyltransferase involved in cell wall biosynthesis [Microbacterium esteraromaticum]